MQKELDPLIYGTLIHFKKAGVYKKAIVMFSQQNFSFIEFVKENFDIVRTLNVFHLIEVRRVVKNYEYQNQKKYQLIFRLRNFKENFKLYFDYEDERNLIGDAFDVIIQNLKRVPFAEYSIKNLIRQVLYDSNIANIDNVFSLNDLDKLLDNLGIKLQSQDKNKLIRKTVQKTKQLTQFDFRRVFKVLLLKEELANIYKEILKIDKYQMIKKQKIPLYKLLDWVAENQGQSISELQIQNFYRQTSSPNIFQIKEEDIDEINFEQFCNFFYSSLNSLIDPEKVDVDIDMNRPFDDYYINSSFNSYLLGHQVYGKPSIEGYLRCLDLGCRLIQIDVWDGYDEENPVITHSKTFNQSLTFRNLIEVLKTRAFKNSDFPLILNLQLNVTTKTRDIIAKILHDNLGENFYYLNQSLFKKKNLPVLGLLKNKILILAKTSYPSYVLNENEKNVRKKMHQEMLGQYATFYQEQYNEGGLRTIFGYSQLTEKELDEILQSKITRNSCLDFHKDYLSICYPNKQRVDSSNFNPVKAWNRGIQSSALNLTGSDIYKLYNIAKFRVNKNSGYMLKPDILYSDVMYQPVNKPRMNLRIKVIASQILKAKRNSNHQIFPYVEIYIDGKEIDTKNNEIYTSEIAQQNLFHSIYGDNDDDDVFQFKVVFPEFAFVIFQIRDAKSREILKRQVVSFNSIRQGLRCLELLEDDTYHDSCSYLLLNIKIKNLDQLNNQLEQFTVYLKFVFSLIFLLGVSQINCYNLLRLIFFL